MIFNEKEFAQIIEKGLQQAEPALQKAKAITWTDGYIAGWQDAFKKCRELSGVPFVEYTENKRKELEAIVIKIFQSRKGE